MKLVTIEDFRDLYLKCIQRGGSFILSKFSLSEKKRTKSSFNEINFNHANWWIIPLVKKRWNFLITGDENITYEEYLTEKYADKVEIKLVSIGSGICSHELLLAKLNPNWQITCIDFSEKLLSEAKNKADQQGLTNIHFLAKDIYKHNLPSNHYDIVLFHSSLHHFKQLESFIDRIYKSLALKGKLIINEYVGKNRLQFDKFQIQEINNCLKLINKEYRKIFKTNIYKNKYYGSGLLRMILSDPSECIESEKIIPVIHKKFKIVEERGFGGNLLMSALKDIAHNFLELNEEKTKCLDQIFKYEDEYIKNNQSDFIFGIYEKS